MNIKIQSVKFDADQKLIKYTEEKLMKIKRFHSDIDQGEVTLSVDYDAKNGNKISNVILFAKGEKYQARRRSRNFKKAVKDSVEAIRNQITKQKEQQQFI